MEPHLVLFNLLMEKKKGLKWGFFPKNLNHLIDSRDSV